MLCCTAAAITSAHPGLLPNPLKGQTAGTTPRCGHWSPSSVPAHKAAALTLGSAGSHSPQKVQGREGWKLGVLSKCLAFPHLILLPPEGSTHTSTPILLSRCFFLQLNSFYCPFFFFLLKSLNFYRLVSHYLLSSLCSWGALLFHIWSFLKHKLYHSFTVYYCPFLWTFSRCTTSLLKLQEPVLHIVFKKMKVKQGLIHDVLFCSLFLSQ